MIGKCLLHHADDAALVEPDVYLVPLLDIGGCLDDGAAWQLRGDAVAPGQDAQRAQAVESGHCPVERLLFQLDQVAGIFP